MVLIKKLNIETYSDPIYSPILTNKNIKDLKRIHKILFEIMEVFHNICIKHNIAYFLIAGSLIGCLRHEDIIPFDDYVDIGIYVSKEDNIQYLKKI